MFVLPDFPDTWKKLTPLEKHVANRRLAIDAAEADVDEKGGMSQLRGIKLAFSDPKTYMLAIIYHGQTGAAGIQNYFPTLTQTIEKNKVDALLLVSADYIRSTCHYTDHKHSARHRTFSWSSGPFFTRTPVTGSVIVSGS